MKKKLIFILFVNFLLVPGISFAASYDFYVDSSVSESGDGSKKHPFLSIEKAVDATKNAGGNKKIFVENGEYVGNFVVGNAIHVIGESESGVVVSGTVNMEDGSSLENLTVKDRSNAIGKAEKFYYRNWRAAG